jgi:hypothetical protein
VRAFGDAEALSAILEHLGHERNAFVSAVLVERLKDFVPAPNLYPISDPEFFMSHMLSGHQSA